MVDYENRILTLEEAEKENREEHKEIMRRLNEKDIADALMRQQLDTVVKTTNRIEEKLDKQNEKMQQELDTQKEKMQQEINKEKEKPAKRWETAITAIITGTIGIAIGIIGAIVTNYLGK